MSSNKLGKTPTKACGIWLFALLFSQQLHANDGSLLQHLITQSQLNDPWLRQNTHMAAAELSQAAAAGTLPNMQISVGVNNVATDGFDFNQEAMSQFKVGLSQRFPRGQSRHLNQLQLQQQAAARPYLEDARKATLAMQVTTKVLLIKEAQRNMVLNQQNNRFTTDLLRLSEAAYKSAFGQTQQQDLIRAQLELVSNEDSLVRFEQQLLTQLAELQVMLGAEQQPTEITAALMQGMATPKIQILQTDSVQNTKQQWLQFEQHPKILATQQQVQAAETKLQLAEQQKKPAFTVNTGYGHRAATPNGVGRADLFSVGLSFDLPMLNKHKTHQIVLHSAQQLEALRAEKDQQLQQMQQALSSQGSQLKSLLRRIELHQQQLIPQLQQLAETNVNAYSNEGGDFSEVMRSQLAAVEAQITLNGLQTQAAITTMNINYLLMQNSQQFISTINPTGTSHD